MWLITMEANSPWRSIGYRNSSLNLVRDLLEVMVNAGHPAYTTFGDLPALQQTLRGSIAPQGHRTPPRTDHAGR